MSSLATDLAEAAGILETIARADFEWTKDGVSSLAESMRNFAKRARVLENELRSRHVDGVVAGLDAARQSVDIECAISEGVRAGVIVDLRAVFADELEFNGRPIPGSGGAA